MMRHCEQLTPCTPLNLNLVLTQCLRQREHVLFSCPHTSVGLCFGNAAKVFRPLHITHWRANRGAVVVVDDDNVGNELDVGGTMIVE